MNAIGAIRPFLDAEVGSASPLVELSAIMSMPGSIDQDVHSDIPFQNSLILAGFVALKDIKASDGPTCVYMGSHTELFHRWKSTTSTMPNPESPKYYNSDGSYIDDDDKVPSVGQEAEEMDEESSAAMAGIANSPPLSALLDEGDVLLFDTKLFHFGSANTSLLPRNLLCFAFQGPCQRGLVEPIKGYTYHISAAVKSQGLCVRDFPAIT